jgi:hypothetical protein
MARVAVADDVWADFRNAIHPRSVSDALGALVEREVDRYRSRRLKAGQLDDADIQDALDHAQRQQDDLALLVARLERLQRADQLMAQQDRAPWETDP